MRTLVRCAALFLLFISTAASASDDLARQVLAETNLARTSPQRYVQHLRDLRRRYLGKGYLTPGKVGIVMTSEGVPAVDEAIQFLTAQKPLAPLSWSPGLAEAAADLVRDEGATGQIGHTGSQSGDTRERIERHGTWRSQIAENIGYGPETARLMVMQLIVDDGVPERGHRANIFNPAFKTAGAACGPHPEFRTMCVMDFAAGFKDKR